MYFRSQLLNPLIYMHHHKYAIFETALTLIYKNGTIFSIRTEYGAIFMLLDQNRLIVFLVILICHIKALSQMV